jgi:hypothetical protein
MPRQRRRALEGRSNTAQKRPVMTLDHFSALLDREIEDDAFDSALHSLWLDILGIYADCSTLKDNIVVRNCFPPADEHPTWFDETADPYINVQRSGGEKHQESDEQKCWNEIQQAMKAFHAPLTLTTKLCDEIRELPQRNVTLYIRLDEEVPRNSCTAYEVDWDGFLQGKKDNLFTIFRLCNVPVDLSRSRCIAGTFASACLHPYTVVLPGQTQPMFTNGAQSVASGEREIMDGIDGDDPPNVRTPFRPIRLLLDRPEDVCTNELQYYLTRMGLTQCQEVSPKLQLLHDAEELDFFPKGDILSVPSVACVLAPTEPMMPINLGSWKTSMPFPCVQNRCDSEDEVVQSTSKSKKVGKRNRWEEDDVDDEREPDDQSYEEESQSSVVSDVS